MSTDERQPGERQPTEEELRAALQEELRQVRIEQVVTEATVSILNIAVMRSGLVPGSEGERDLDQVRIGIEAVRGLLPLVEQLAGEQAKPIRDALSQLQMAYVRALDEGTGAGAAGPGGTPPAPSGDAPPPSGDAPPPPAAAKDQPGADGPGPAQQSGRLWVPGQ